MTREGKKIKKARGKLKFFRFFPGIACPLVVSPLAYMLLLIKA